VGKIIKLKKVHEWVKIVKDVARVRTCARGVGPETDLDADRGLNERINSGEADDHDRRLNLRELRLFQYGAYLRIHGGWGARAASDARARIRNRPPWRSSVCKH
jgi:hypothetical protein